MVVAIAGGIGSGKSVVSSILRIMGFIVYDCDSEAKRLMNTSCEIKNDLVEAFGTDCITETGTINSAYIASVVFKNKVALSKINSIVHPRVKTDILLKLKNSNQQVMFVETAILMQSNLLDIVDEVWLVSASEETRIKRVMKRNGMSVDDVKKRIHAQQNQDYSKLNNCKNIVNEECEAILPQIRLLIDGLCPK